METHLEHRDEISALQRLCADLDQRSDLARKHIARGRFAAAAAQLYAMADELRARSMADLITEEFASLNASGFLPSRSHGVRLRFILTDRAYTQHNQLADAEAERERLTKKTGKSFKLLKLVNIASRDVPHFLGTLLPAPGVSE